MNVIQFSYKYPPLLPRDSVLVLGFFDCIHLGHQELIKSAIKSGLKVFLMTFSSAPKAFFTNTIAKDVYPKMKRFYMFSSYHVDSLLVLQSEEEMFNLTKNEFIEKVLKPMHPKKIICGFDYSYGLNKEGTPEYLKNYFDVTIIKSFNYENEKISTTRIKRLLDQGNIKEVNILLGRHYSIGGVIVKGAQVGRSLGFKTINIELPDDLYIPKLGVYSTYIYINDKIYKTISNLGIHPTLNTLAKPNLETHILDFDGELLDKNIIINFTDFIREERKFKLKEELVKQIELDINSIK